MSVRNLATENLLSLYLREIRTTPILSRGEERALLRRAAVGDQQAKEKLVKANLRFVVMVARRYQAFGVPLMDLISEGNMGLLNALEHFDFQAGSHFISYAVWWIRNSIQHAVACKDMIRLPENKLRMLKEMTRPQGVVSLDAPLRTDGESLPVEECLADTSQLRPEDYAMESALRQDITAVLTTLTRREAEIIQSRYGLNGRREMSLQEIASRYTLTRERVRQIEKVALMRLRRHGRSSVLRGYC